MKDAKGHGSNPRGGAAAHSQGVQQIGQPPINRTSLKRQYSRNETMNNHSANVVLLAKNFGTEDEHAKAREIVAERNKQGSLPTSTRSVPNVREFQYGINQKYYPLLIGNQS